LQGLTSTVRQPSDRLVGFAPDDKISGSIGAEGPRLQDGRFDVPSTKTKGKSMMKATRELVLLGAVAIAIGSVFNNDSVIVLRKED